MFSAAFGRACPFSEAMEDRILSIESESTLPGGNINDAPVVTPPLGDRRAIVGASFDLPIPAQTITDPDLGDTLSGSATQSDGSALPNWLNLDSSAAKLSGTPGRADVGPLTIRLTATNSAGASVSDEFRLEVVLTNQAPVASSLDDQAASQGTPFSHALPAGSFSDADIGDLLSVQARLLAADATTAVRFIPVDRWRGQLTGGLTLRAWDQSSGAAGQLADTRNSAGDSAFSSATARVGITVTVVNHAPELLLPIADDAAVEAQALEWQLSPASFIDSDAGDTLSYRATLASGAQLPGWLKFDPVTLTFKGRPQLADIGSMTVRLTATDAAGASARGVFVIKVVQADAIAVPPSIEIAPENTAAERDPAPVEDAPTDAQAPGLLVIDNLDQAAGRLGLADGVLATATPILFESNVRSSTCFQEAVQAAAIDDFEQLSALAHWLKGAGGSMGYDELFEPSRSLEMAAHSRDLQSVSRHLAELERLSQRIDRGLNQLELAEEVDT